MPVAARGFCRCQQPAALTFIDTLAHLPDDARMPSSRRVNTATPTSSGNPIQYNNISLTEMPYGVVDGLVVASAHSGHHGLHLPHVTGSASPCLKVTFDSRLVPIHGASFTHLQNTPGFLDGLQIYTADRVVFTAALKQNQLLSIAGVQT